MSNLDITLRQRQTAKPEWFRGLIFASPGLAWLVVFFVLPLLGMILYSLFRLEGGELVTDLSLDNYERLISQAGLRGSLWVSLKIAMLTTIISVILAYPFSCFLAFVVPERWQRIALVLSVLPFWTSYVVRSYSWLLVLAPTGVVNQTMLGLGIVDEPLRLSFGPGATILGFVHFFVPLTTLTIYANLKQLNPRLVLAAQDLGASKWRAFLHVTVPLSVPGVAVGMFLSFVICIGDYITPQILGGNRELVMPQAILFQISRRGDFPMASAMAMVLMIVVAITYLLCSRWLSMKRM